MLELLLSPRKAERRPWEMFFIGLFYASLSVLLVNWLFSGDSVLSKYSGMIVVTFSVMFTMPFIYYVFRHEEERDMNYQGAFKMLWQHRKALFALMWLFLGLVVAFSFWYIVLSSGQNFKVQIETYCQINRPGNFNECVSQYGIEKTSKATGYATSTNKFFAIFANNIKVLIITLIFSLIFGAGAIFILSWNASVIAAAIGIYSKSNLAALPCGLGRYLIHGVPEIAAYFVAAIAGGIISMGIVKHDVRGEKLWDIMQDTLNLIILAIIILLIAAFVEVYITPDVFNLLCG